jgi:hypothetical protein
MKKVIAATLAAFSTVAPAAPETAPPLNADAAKAVIAAEAGTWDADIIFPSNEAGKPDGKAHGVQVNELRSGGTWMLNLFSVDGTPYQGTGIWGFDRTSGRFSGVWTDNNDAQIRFDDGRWDDAAKTMTWTARMVQPGGGWMVTIATEKFMGETRTFDLVALSRKGEVPLIRILFKRRKG